MNGAARTITYSWAFVCAVSLSSGCFNDDGRGEAGDASASETSDSASTATSTSDDISTTTATGTASDVTSAGTTGPTTQGDATNETNETNETGETTEDPSTSATSDTNTTDPSTTVEPTTMEPTTMEPTTMEPTTMDPTTSSTSDDIVCEDINLGDCNGNQDDGCETNLDQSIPHCGACDNPCEGACIEGNCKPGKLVFITDKKFTGKIGGLNGADGQCQEAAASGDLPGEYKAWLSGDAQDDPESRFIPADKPYLLVNGIPIAGDWADLVDGTLEHPINIDANGNMVDGSDACGSTQVWSNTQATGFGFVDQRNCDKWTADENIMVGRVGLAGATSSLWSYGECDDTYSYCHVPRHLYCFGQ